MKNALSACHIFYLNYKSYTFKQTKIYCSPWSVKGITCIFVTERGSKSFTTLKWTQKGLCMFSKC